MAGVDFNRIATNIAALNTLNSLRQINNKLSTSQTRLATGKRINEAADDPAGLSIATKLNARSESMKVAINNIGDAKNLLAVAEGGLSKMSDLLIQIRSKAEQAASDTEGSTERSAIKQEIQSLAEQVQNIVNETKWNGQKLLDGTFNKQFQTGTDNGENTTFSLTQAFDPTTLGVSSSNANASISAGSTFTGSSFTAVGTGTAFSGLTALDTGQYTATVLAKAASGTVGLATSSGTLPTNVASVQAEDASGNASSELSYDTTGGYNGASGGSFTLVIDSYTAAGANAYGTIGYTVKDSTGTALFSVANQTLASGTGATSTSILRSAGGNTSGVKLNISAREQNITAGSTIAFDYVAAGKVKVQVADASGTVVTVDKDGSNKTTGAGTTGTAGYYSAGGAVDIGRGVQLTVAAIGSTAANDTAKFTYNEKGSYVVNVQTAAAASSYMATIDNVIDTVNKGLASVGSLTERLNAKEDTMSTAQVNTEAAYNRIMNADMAAEHVDATKYGILQQTALAMLSQVNNAPQNILTLFR